MNGRILVFALAGSMLAPAGASAQDAVSILRGTLAETLAERAGERAGRHSTSDVTETSPAAGLAELTEDQLDEGAKEAAGAKISTAKAEVADGDGNKAGLRLRAGYDTNYDELVQPEGSRFVEITGDFAVETTVQDTEMFASGSGTFLNLPDLDLDKRFGVELAAGGRREVGEGIFLEGAVGADVDAYDNPVVVEPAAALALQFIDSSIAAAVRASVDGEETIQTRREGTEDDDEEDDEDDSNVDFQRTSLETTIVLSPEASLAPIVSARVSRVRFPDPTIRTEDEAISGDADPDDEGEGVRLVRDATDMTVAAGLRIRPNEDFSLTLSGRANRRDFEQPGAASFSSYAPDVELSWTLAEDATLTLSTTRIIDQPDEDGSLAEDVRSYGATLGYDPDLGFGTKAAVGFSQIREIGVEADSDESFIDLSLNYKPSLETIFEASLHQSWTKDISFGEDTDSTQISAAIRAAF